MHAEDKEDTQKGVREVYDHFDIELKCMDIQDILSSRFKESDGKLYLQVWWSDRQESYINAELLQSDDPMRLAKYIKDHPVEQSRGGYWSQWASNTLNTISRTIRRIRSMYRITGLNDNTYPYSQRIIHRRKAYPTKMETFMSVEIPRNIREAM